MTAGQTLRLDPQDRRPPRRKEPPDDASRAARKPRRRRWWVFLLRWSVVLAIWGVLLPGWCCWCSRGICRGRTQRWTRRAGPA